MLRLALAALAVLALAACGETSTGVPGDETPPQAELRLEQRFVGDSLYIEGSQSYVRLETADGERMREQRIFTFPEVKPVSLTLEPGSYRLVSYQRPCSGNCGYLDPPTDRCEKPFELSEGARLAVRIEVHPGSGCTIQVEPA